MSKKLKILKKDRDRVVKRISEDYTNEDIVNISILNSTTWLKRDNLIEELKTDLSELQLLKKENKDTSEFEEKIKDKMEKISLVNSNKSSHAFIEGVSVRYRGYAIKMKEDLIKEYDAKTLIEFSLIEQIVSSNIKFIACSKKMIEASEFDYFGNDRNNFLKFLSIEKDRAFRQFISGTQALQQLKQPSLNIKINTKNAFIAQNQQLNSNSENNDTK